MIICAQLQEHPQDYILSSNNSFSAVALKSWRAADTEAVLRASVWGTRRGTRAAATSHVCVFNITEV